MPPARRLLLPACLVLGFATPGAHAFKAHDHGEGLRTVDVRSGDRGPVAEATRRAREAMASRLGAEGFVDVDRLSGGVKNLGSTGAFVTGRSDDGPAAIALDYVRSHPATFGLDGADLENLELVARYRSASGTTHLTWFQTVAGIRTYDNRLDASVDDEGRIIRIGSTLVHGVTLADTTPTLTKAQGLAEAQDRAGADRFDPGEADPELRVLVGPDGPRLGWAAVVAGESPFVYQQLIDAESGALLVRRQTTAFAAADVYNRDPGEGAPHTVDLAGPGGVWLNDSASSTRLRGQNVHAYTDLNNSNGVSAGEDVPATVGETWGYAITSVAPDAGTSQFCPTTPIAGPCSWNGVSGSTSSSVNNHRQGAVQVFYLNNVFHDWLATSSIAFTAASHNFETTDRVIAEASDGNGAGNNSNNANMSTPADGTSPKMQMYLFKKAAGANFPAVDGDNDGVIVLHEYTHGLSNRLVGNGTATGLQELQPRAMGEGWSDWFAVDYMVANGFSADAAADGENASGEYATNNPDTAIRTAAIDCSVGSAVPACAGSASAGPGGYTLGDMGNVLTFNGQGYFQVHADGEIWGQTLWDLRKALGGDTARRLIAEGMRLAPVNPSYLDMRDAILQADLAAGGTNRTAIWGVFAARGMGYSARVFSDRSTGAKESFDLPAVAARSSHTLDDAAPIGDADNSLEPGEATRLTIALRNPGTAGLTNVKGALSTTTPGAVVGQPTVSYGSIASGAASTGGGVFAVTVPSTQACGTVVNLSLAVSSDQGATTIPLALQLSDGALETFTQAASTPIPDGLGANFPGATATSTISIPTAGRVDRLTVSVNATHTYVGDLQLSLVSPAGTVVALAERAGPSASGGTEGNNLAVTFDDDATALFQEVTQTATNFTGAFKPSVPLAKFNGQARLGTWTLRARDWFNGDTGTVTSWSLQTDSPACSSTPPALPTATTGASSAVTANGATLAGSVDPQGTATQRAFQFGTTTAYGQTTTPVDAGAGSGAAAGTAELTGLAPSTTYHFRAVALRGGTVVAVGDDATFTTPAAPVDPGGGGGGGGGGGTTTTPGGGTTTTPGGGTKSPAPSFSGGATTVTVDKKGLLTYGFTAAPPGATGLLVLASAKAVAAAKPKKKILKLGSKPFTVPANGKVAVKVKLSSKNLKKLKKLKRLKVKATITIGGQAFTATFTLKPPKAKKK